MDPQRKEQIAAGNPNNRPADFSRDLSMRQREYWETRPYPAKRHHWTEAEFEQFLETHRYPSPTHRDHLVGRSTDIRNALVAGEFIPEEVMADPSTQGAIGDAIMTIEADEAGAMKRHVQEQGQAQFKRAIGYCEHIDVYQSRLDGLLAMAARAEGRKVGMGGLSDILSPVKPVSLEGLEFGLTVSRRTHPQGSPHHGRRSWLEIRDARYNDVSVYGDVYRIEFADAEVIYRRLLEAQQITLPQVRSVMGELWRPYTIVRACAGDTAPAATEAATPGRAKKSAAPSM